MCALLRVLSCRRRGNDNLSTSFYVRPNEMIVSSDAVGEEGIRSFNMNMTF